ncbi:hypothetical protein [Parasphingorhabdus pacifica]
MEAHNAAAGDGSGDPAGKPAELVARAELSSSIVDGVAEYRVGEPPAGG